MAYDRDSFLAGLAVGRTLWKPQTINDNGGYFPVIRDDVQRVSDGNLWWGPFDFVTYMRYPDTQRSESHYDVQYGHYSVNASWIADSAVSWEVTFDYSADGPEWPDCYAGLRECFIHTTRFHERGYSVSTVGSKAYDFRYRTIDGQNHRSTAYYSADRVIDPGQSSAPIVNVATGIVGGKWGPEHFTHLEGYIYLPLLRKERNAI